MPRILDACCGSRMFWFDKQNPDVVFLDNREEQCTLCDGRSLSINPSVIGDFRSMPFPDNTFDHVVFDPPHLLHAGPDSWLAKKYGLLGETWKEDIKQGFNECMRVLKSGHTMTFKWSDEQISFMDILKIIATPPLYGDKRGNTRWVVFYKKGDETHE